MKVDFSAKYSCENGEVLLVTGGHESIGNWNVKDALVLEMGDGEIYEVCVMVSTLGMDLAFLFVVAGRTEGMC